MRVLVVAGTGFIGGHAAQTFVQRGDTVTALVRSRARAIADERLASTTLIEGDLDALPHQMLDTPHDVVIYAAGAWQRDRVVTRAEIEQRCQTVYSDGVEHLAERAHQWKAHFVFMSGISRFGDVAWDCPLTEDTPPGELQIFGRFKRRSEEILSRWGSRGLRWTALCPHEVYGSHDVGGYVRFMHQRIRARRFVHLGDGANRWSFCNVANVAEAMVTVCDGEGRGLLLVADTRAWSLREVADALTQASGGSSHFLRVPRWMALALASVNVRIPRPKSAPWPFGPQHVRVRTSTMLLDTKRAALAGVIPRHGLQNGIGAAVAWWEGPGRATL